MSISRLAVHAAYVREWTNHVSEPLAWLRSLSPPPKFSRQPLEEVAQATTASTAASEQDDPCESGKVTEEELIGLLHQAEDALHGFKDRLAHLRKLHARALTAKAANTQHAAVSDGCGETAASFADANQSHGVANEDQQEDSQLHDGSAVQIGVVMREGCPRAPLSDYSPECYYNLDYRWDMSDSSSDVESDANKQSSADHPTVLCGPGSISLVRAPSDELRFSRSLVQRAAAAGAKEADNAPEALPAPESQAIHDQQRVAPNGTAANAPMMDYSKLTRDGSRGSTFASRSDSLDVLRNAASSLASKLQRQAEVLASSKRECSDTRMRHYGSASRTRPADSSAEHRRAASPDRQRGRTRPSNPSVGENRRGRPRSAPTHWKQKQAGAFARRAKIFTPQAPLHQSTPPVAAAVAANTLDMEPLGDMNRSEAAQLIGQPSMGPVEAPPRACSPGRIVFLSNPQSPPSSCSLAGVVFKGNATTTASSRSPSPTPRVCPDVSVVQVRRSPSPTPGVSQDVSVVQVRRVPSPTPRASQDVSAVQMRSLSPAAHPAFTSRRVVSLPAAYASAVSAIPPPPVAAPTVSAQLVASAACLPLWSPPPLVEAGEAMSRFKSPDSEGRPCSHSMPFASQPQRMINGRRQNTPGNSRSDSHGQVSKRIGDRGRDNRSLSNTAGIGASARLLRTNSSAICSSHGSIRTDSSNKGRVSPRPATQRNFAAAGHDRRRV